MNYTGQNLSSQQPESGPVILVRLSDNDLTYGIIKMNYCGQGLHGIRLCGWLFRVSFERHCGLKTCKVVPLKTPIQRDCL